MANLPILSINEVETCYYLRLSAKDLPGVLADVTAILADEQISIDAMLQKPAAATGETAEIVIVTHLAIEQNINVAIAKIEALTSTHGKVVKLRLEHLNG
jgi:homoserine dehydrogenase